MTYIMIEWRKIPIESRVLIDFHEFFMLDTGDVNCIIEQELGQWIESGFGRALK